MRTLPVTLPKRAEPAPGNPSLAGVPFGPVSRAAYLRVYVPVDHFDGYLEHVAADRQATRPVLTRGRYGVWYESSRDDAFVIEFEGERFVCPRHPRLRMLEGLIAFRNAYPGPVATALVPDQVAVRATADLDRIHQRQPTARSHILTSPFYVPLRWFAAFDPSEREIIEGSAGLTVRYRTRLREAMARMERAADTLDAVGFDDTVVEQVRDVARWMEPFPEHSVVELDYGEVAAFFDDAELALDESAADVAASLEALARGDLESAGEHYADAASRWAFVQSLTYSN